MIFSEYKNRHIRVVLLSSFINPNNILHYIFISVSFISLWLPSFMWMESPNYEIKIIAYNISQDFAKKGKKQLNFSDFFVFVCVIRALSFRSIMNALRFINYRNSGKLFTNSRSSELNFNPHYIPSGQPDKYHPLNCRVSDGLKVRVRHLIQKV